MTEAADIQSLIQPLKQLHQIVRAAVVESCERSAVEDLAAIAREEEGDTIYAVDRVSEELDLGPRLGAESLVATKIRCSAANTRPYFGAVDGDSEDRIVRPASVYCPNKRTVATASKVTGTHIPPSGANCRVI